MATIRRTKKDGSLFVGYRPGPNMKEECITLPDQEAFELFDLMETQAKRRGEVFRPQSGLTGEPIPMAGRSSDAPTLRDWMGGTKVEDIGLYFNYTTTGESYRQSITNIMLNWAYPYIGDLPLDLITQEHLIAMVDEWVVCPACAARAKKRGLKLSAKELAVHRDPFDGACIAVDANGVEQSSHYLTVKRATLITNIKRVRTAFQLPIKKRLFGIALNPGFGVEIPKFSDRPSDGEERQAFSAQQLRLIVECSPEGYELVPDLATITFLRPSEWGGISVGDFRWTTDPEDGVMLSLRAVFISNGGGKPELRHYGKTSLALTPVHLPPTIAAAVRRHLETYRSTANRDACAACRDGMGHWYEDGPNPHLSCDFADSAPLFVGPNGNRLAPAYYTSRIWPLIREAASLTPEVLGWRADPRHFRSTGATLALEAGVDIDVVVRMGRWASREILEKHYIRVREERVAEGAFVLDEYLARESGINSFAEERAERQISALRARIALLETRNRVLTALVVELGGDPATAGTNRATLPRRRTRSVFDDVDRLTDSVTTSRSRSEILARLRIKRTRHNMDRLVVAATLNGLTLPPIGGEVDKQEGDAAEAA